MILGGQGLRETGLHTAARIKAATGCDLLADTFPGYVERGVGLPNVARIPYFPEPALELLSKYQAFVLVGANEPVTFFGYEGIPSHLISDYQRKLVMASEDDNAAAALDALADHLDAPPLSSIEKGVFAGPGDFGILNGDLTPEGACLTVAALQPEGGIIVDEGLTSALQYYPATANSPPHSFVTVSGGSIGYGIPCATGAAIACPDRPVINFQADGSAMYTVQALWTQAREGLDVTTLIASNRSYNILKLELDRAGISEPGPNTLSLIDLSRPCIDWASVARGMGVPGVAVRTAEQLSDELSRALAEPGPHLIDMVLA
jgi:acetolactate synthase-1/2/3 large subunit